MHPKQYPQVPPRSIVLCSSTFPTLEKTKIDHNPVVNNLIVTVAQVLPRSYRQLKQIFQDFAIHTRSSPGFDEAEEDTNEGVLAVKFIMGRDLAVTRPSPDSC